VNLLLGIANKFLESLYSSSSSAVPLNIRYSLFLIKKEVTAKFGASVVNNVISCMLFLRFLTPCILQPQAYGLARFAPSPDAFRGLLIISKVLQCIANGITKSNISNLSTVDPIVSAFITKHIPLVKQFCQNVTDKLDLDLVNRLNSKRSSSRKAASLRQLQQFISFIETEGHSQKSAASPQNNKKVLVSLEEMNEEFAADSGLARAKLTKSTGNLLNVEEKFELESKSLQAMTDQDSTVGWEPVVTRYGYVLKRMAYQYRICFLVKGAIPEQKAEVIQEFLATRTIKDWSTLLEGVDADGSDYLDMDALYEGGDSSSGSSGGSPAPQGITGNVKDLSLRIVLPLPYTSRDFVCRQKVEKQGRNKVKMVWIPIRRSDTPITPGNVRGSMHMALIFSTSNGHTKFKFLTFFDPKTKMPEWIIEHLSLVSFNAAFKFTHMLAAFQPTQQIPASLPARVLSLPKNPTQWTTKHCSDWVQGSLNMGSHIAAAFAKNEVAGDTLLELTDADLQSMGLAKLGERKRLLTNIAVIKKRGFIPFLLSPASSLGSQSQSQGDSSDSIDSEEEATMTLRCFYDDEIEIVTVSRDISFKNLRKQLARQFSLSNSSNLTSSSRSGFTIKYKDVDGDMIALRSESDWAECLLELGQGSSYSPSPRTLTPSSSQSSLSNYATTGASISRSSSPHQGNSVSAALSSLNLAQHSRGIKLYIIEASQSKSSEMVEDPAGSSEMDSNFEFYHLFDAILDPVVIINEFGIMQYVNSKVQGLLGYHMSEMVGRNVSMIQTPEIAPFHDTFLKNYMRTGVSRIIGVGRDVEAVKKDGTIINIFLEVSARQLADSVVYIGVLKAREKTMVKSMLQIEKEVIGTLQVPAIIIDSKGTINGFNKASEQLFGYTFMEMVGKNVKVLMTGSDADNHDEYLKRFTETKAPKIIGRGRKVIIQRKDGTLASIFLTVTEKREGEKSFFTGILQTTTPLMARNRESIGE
jgi:PAS domain S-box-containing protein